MERKPTIMKAGITAGRTRRLLAVACLGLAWPASAQATDFFWGGSGVTDDWFDPFNWVNQQVPSGGTGNNAFILNGDTAEILTTIPDIEDITVGGSIFQPSTLIHRGGSTVPFGGLTNARMIVGPEGGSGIYQMTGSAIQAKAFMFVGYSQEDVGPGGNGTLLMNGNATFVGVQLNAGVGGGPANRSTANIFLTQAASIDTGQWLRLENGQMTMADTTIANIGTDLWVGQGEGGDATLNLQGNSIVQVNGDIRIGRDDARGEINLGADARLIKTGVDAGNIAIGSLGDVGGGVLNISGNALLQSDTNLVLAEALGRTGLVRQTGGTVILKDRSLLAIQNESLIIDAAGGGLGRYELSGGSLITQSVDALTGTFEFTGGLLKVAEVFKGNLNQEGGVFSPGASPLDVEIEGNYDLADDGTLQLEIAGTTPGSEHDTLLVTGDVNLAGGTLEVLLLGGFSPAAGDSYDFLTWWGTLTGTFDVLDLPTLDPGLSWDTDDLYSNGVLSVGIAGDTDGDGDVDDADLGTSFANYTGPIGAAGGKGFSLGDNDYDGDVDDADLGSSFASYTGPLAPQVVPEPGSLVLGLASGTMLMMRRRR